METLPPSSSARRSRLRERSRMRSATLRERPWSQLPGVTCYVVYDPAGMMTDKWGEPGLEGLAKAGAFRARVASGVLQGSFALEPAGDDLRLLSVARRDGWFVHAWLVSECDVTGILSVIGG